MPATPLPRTILPGLRIFPETSAATLFVPVLAGSEYIIQGGASQLFSLPLVLVYHDQLDTTAEQVTLTFKPSL